MASVPRRRSSGVPPHDLSLAADLWFPELAAGSTANRRPAQARVSVCGNGVLTPDDAEYLTTLFGTPFDMRIVDDD
jgi:hypothetical protein